MKNFLNHVLNGFIIYTLPVTVLANFDLPALVIGVSLIWVSSTTNYLNMKEPKT